MKVKRLLYTMLLLIAITFCAGERAIVAMEPMGTGEIAVFATGKFDFEIPGNTARKASSSFPLEAGEVVTIKATYSPFSASVDFGLIAPDGLFYGLNTTTGSFDKAIEVNQRGNYTLAVRNNSAMTISVSGYVNY